MSLTVILIGLINDVIFQELPYQLTQINDPVRLSRCLTDWNVFDSLYNEEYSAKLLLYWRQVSVANWKYKPSPPLPFPNREEILRYKLFS